MGYFWIYNAVAMFVVKFDKTGKYIWSIPLYNGVVTEGLSIACDNDGNVIVSAKQNDTVTVYQRLGNAIRYYNDINKVSVSNINIFTVKYDTDGKCLWTNRLGSDAGGGATGESFQPCSTIDSYGNYYLACQVSGANCYIYDTRNIDSHRYIDLTHILSAGSC